MPFSADISANVLTVQLCLLNLTRRRVSPNVAVAIYGCSSFGY